MAVSTVRRNQVIDWNDVSYRLVGLSEDNYWQLVSMKDAKTTRIAVDELLEQYRVGNLRLRVIADEKRDIAAEFREATDPPLKVVGKARKADRLIALEKATRAQRLQDARRQTTLVQLAGKYPLGPRYRRRRCVMLGPVSSASRHPRNFLSNRLSGSG